MRDFRIVRRLGVGGFAFVFLVERAGRHYTLKMAAQPASEVDEDRVDAWMRREVLSLECLEHPHLLPVIEWGRWPEPETGYAWFVTPYVAGSTFHAWRWREQASLYRAVGVLCGVLETLESLHARGVCHRDIKADNLLVRHEDDQPFLIDFGAVHLPWARALTEGLAPGTLHCQPPEAIAFLVSEAARQGSRLEALPAADLYAFGVLLYETLTNCHPFNPRLPLEQLLVAIASSPPPEPQRLAPEAPASLCALALRLLSKEPEQRPPSARAVREELERLREQEGHTAPWQAPARRPSDGERGLAPFPDVDMLEENPGPESSPSEAAHLLTRVWRVLRWPVRLVALALVLGLLGIGWTLLRAPAPPAPSVKGTQTVSPAPLPESTSSSSPAQPPSRLCALLTQLLGVAVAQLAGCVTVPSRPDPITYLASCSLESRATPVKLGFAPRENPSFLKTGTPASDDSIEEGGSINVKPGPVTASMFAEVKGQEMRVMISGQAMTLPHRLYMQFDQLHLPDGTSLPICGVAVDGLHQYGIPTYAKLPMRGARVDPVKVDTSPGSVVLNDPRFETVLQGPEGYPLPRVGWAPPDWR